MLAYILEARTDLKILLEGREKTKLKKGERIIRTSLKESKRLLGLFSLVGKYKLSEKDFIKFVEANGEDLMEEKTSPESNDDKTLEDLTVKELQAILDERGVPYAKKDKKAQLIVLVEGSEPTPDDEKTDDDTQGSGEGSEGDETDKQD